MEQAVRRIDDRLGVLAVGRERCLARRREFHPPRLDGPGLRIGVVEIDRRHAHDPAVLDVDEHRSAIGHVAIAHGAVGEPRAELPAGGHGRHHGLGPPIGEVLRPLDGEVEILLGVDLVEPVDRRGQQRGADRRVLEGERDVRHGMEPGARGDLAATDLEPAADLLVARLDLGDEVALAEALAELRIAPRRDLHRLGKSPQDDGESGCRDAHGRPSLLGSQVHVCAGTGTASPSPTSGRAGVGVLSCFARPRPRTPPDLAELVIGPAKGRTRWLGHPPRSPGRERQRQARYLPGRLKYFRSGGCWPFLVGIR
jgi:hypothetical protein